MAGENCAATEKTAKRGKPKRKSKCSKKRESTRPRPSSTLNGVLGRIILVPSTEKTQ